MAITMKYDIHLKEFVEESNGLTGIFLDDSKYKIPNTVGLTWDDDEFHHHYKILEWALERTNPTIPSPIEVNQLLMERFMDDLTCKNAGKLRRRDFASNRVIAPAIEVVGLYDRWQAASLRFAASLIDGRHHLGCPVCQAVWMHKVFMYIRPFEDGNGRTARIIWACHQKLMGFEPIQVLCGHDLPMCISCRKDYDQSLIQFTRQVSIVEITEELDNIFQLNTRVNVARCNETEYCNRDFDKKTMYRGYNTPRIYQSSSVTSTSIEKNDETEHYD
jgi:hypothetical protein